MYANAHVLNSAYNDLALRGILNRANLVYCDGVGVNIAARILGSMPLERMTAADWIVDLCALCAREGLGIYLMGGRPGVADRAAEILCRRCPGLSITGAHHGYVSDSRLNEQVLREINASAPSIVLVGMGTPIQEKWIDRNWNRLEVPVTWAVGALFEFVTEDRHRAPRWMLHYGLEWLHRLTMEPTRLWKRYLVGNPIFLWRVLGQRSGLVKTEKGLPSRQQDE